MSKIVTLTMNPAIDASATVERVVPDDKLRCSPPKLDPGGGGINVARAIFELGGRATALWTCGGPMGSLLCQLLDAEGIQHDPLPVHGLTRQNLTVFEESTGQQYRFGMPGPTLTPDEIESCLRKMEAHAHDMTHLVLSGSLPPGAGDDCWARVLALAPQGCRTIVDTAGKALRRAMEAGAFLIKPNLRELTLLSGADLTGEDEIAGAARGLLRRYPLEVVVVSLGAGGALLVTREQIVRLHSPTVPIRSRVGAGDSMVAGIALALARGDSLLDAVRNGVATGAAAVMRTGLELCRRQDVERLMPLVRWHAEE